MNTHAIRSTLIGSLGVALALVAGSAWAITFRITDLGSLGGGSSQGSFGDSLNDSGQATGFSTTSEGETHAFLWDGTRLQDLGAPDEFSNTEGIAINASGQVTGVAPDIEGDAFTAFLWDGTTLTELDAQADPLRALRHSRLRSASVRSASRQAEAEQA
jgi:probable HAF family extracellular repeat protein